MTPNETFSVIRQAHSQPAGDWTLIRSSETLSRLISLLEDY